MPIYSQLFVGKYLLYSQPYVGKSTIKPFFEGGGVLVYRYFSGGGGGGEGEMAQYNTGTNNTIAKKIALQALCHEYVRSRLNIVKDFHAARTSSGLVNSLQAR